MPRGKKPGRPLRWTRRQLIDGIRFRTRTGVPWRDVPERYGPWARSYDLFRRWQRDGTWQRILAELQAQADARELITWDLNIDSTASRAHQHAAGARKRHPMRLICQRRRSGGRVGGVWQHPRHDERRDGPRTGLVPRGRFPHLHADLRAGSAPCGAAQPHGGGPGDLGASIRRRPGGRLG
ncbi:transposase [Streptomyces sp. NPDC101234]|uniref:transposase n=1 Tax=Streptomyces sp. NPDC101234 TaxID=3366138 RepID=UPI0038110EC7